MKQIYEVFADQAFVKIFRMTPEVVTVMGLSKLPQFRGIGGELNDYSPQGQQRRQTLLAEVHAQHCSYEFDRLSVAEQLSYEVFEFFLQYLPFEPWVGLAGDDFRAYNYLVSHHDGAPAETFNMLVNFHDVHSEEDADNYLLRLAVLPKMLTDLEDSLRQSQEQGLSPPRSALDIIITEMRALIDGGVLESELLSSFKAKLYSADTFSDEQRDYYVARAHNLVEQLYRSSLPRFLASMEALYELAGEVLGVSRFHRGQEYYQYCLTRQSSTNFTADEVYKIGNTEVDRLKLELAEAVEALGYDGKNLTDSITKCLHLEREECDDSADRRQEILQYYQQLVADMRTKIRPYFNLFPMGACEVKATPRHLELGRTSTYYPASVTGEYPGIFEVNLSREFSKAAWSRNNLAYHEVYPGHHLQITLAQELGHLPLFRRTFVNGGYLEGWAKYAERLPFETDVDSDPRYELNRKATELLSASNLMLDVGIHLRGWSREDAVAFSMEQALVDRAMAEYLVDRISVTPAQVTAYILGLITVRRERDRAKERMGERFSLMAFHDAILGEGALPLSVMERQLKKSLN